MGLTRVLAATNFSRRSDHALRRAATLCRDGNAALHLLHVVCDDQPAIAADRDVREAGTMLRSIAADISSVAGFAPKSLVTRGDPFRGIVEASAAIDADLVAMGAHRKQFLRDMFVGTTIERVVRRGHRPVLVASRDPSRPYRRILVATDFSQASAHALRTAASMGLLAGAHVTLLHIFEPFAKSTLIYANVHRDVIDEHVAHEAENARRRVAAFFSDNPLEGVRYDVRLKEGQVFSTICNVVDAEDPDLLVIGTDGLSGAKRLLLGSVADVVLRDVRCDVLAVPSSTA